MPIRFKMVLWHLLLTALLLGVSIPILYQMIHTSLYSNLQAQLEASMTQVIAAIELEGPGEVVWDAEHLLSHNTMAVVMEKKWEPAFWQYKHGLGGTKAVLSRPDPLCGHAGRPVDGIG